MRSSGTPYRRKYARPREPQQRIAGHFARRRGNRAFLTIRRQPVTVSERILLSAQIMKGTWWRWHHLIAARRNDSFHPLTNTAPTLLDESQAVAASARRRFERKVPINPLARASSPS